MGFSARAPPDSSRPGGTGFAGGREVKNRGPGDRADGGESRRGCVIFTDAMAAPGILPGAVGARGSPVGGLSICLAETSESLVLVEVRHRAS